MVVSSEWHQTSSITEYTHRPVFHPTTKPTTMEAESQDSVTIVNKNRTAENYSTDDDDRSPHNTFIDQDSIHQVSPGLGQSPDLSRKVFLGTSSNELSQDIRDSNSKTESHTENPPVDTYRDSTLKTESHSESPPVSTWSMDDDFDDMSVASGHSYATYDTNATSESVQDIITRLQSETDRRRRRLLRRRQMRHYENRRSGDRLQKYNSRSSVYVDPKVGITVEIKENP